MAKTKQQIRVLLADDHAIFRDGLRKLLGADEDITIVGEAQNGAAKGTDYRSSVRCSRFIPHQNDARRQFLWKRRDPEGKL